MGKRNKWLAGIIVATSLVLVACGGNTSETGNSEAVSGGDKASFTYAISGDPSSTNPINTSDRWGLTMNNMIYSPLVVVETDGTQRNALAESVEAAEDGLSLTVQLKQEVKWSDGENLTADDVVFTYEQKVKKENGNADQLWINDQPIKIEKVDDYTVKFVLPSPSAAALQNIVSETFIIPEHVFKDEADFSVNDLSSPAVGTGPYRLKEYKRGEYLTFEANEHYYGGEAKIKNVTLRIIESTDTAKVALQKGEVDAAVVLPSDIADLDSGSITTYPYSENRVGYMGVNTISEALKDPKVRQAVFFAINKAELNQAAYLDEQYFSTPYSFLPPNNPYATEDLEKYETNIEKSKELLKEAGVTDLKLNIAFSSTDPAQTIQATLIQQQLQQAGINVTLEGGDGTAIYTELSKPGSTKYNLFLGGYIMGNDPDLYSSLFTTNGSANYFQTKNAETDQLFVDAAIELDPEKRALLYDDLQRAIADDARIYPIVDNKKILAVSNRIGNVEDAGLIPIYTFDDLSKLTIK
ncbi:MULTISPECIES: ABC transporter substrate-binding protein [Enterococcus]|uniref:Peptide ABC transporter substrate-binding protein n=1 Tax=Enterococcus alcedinis TaxID=1274384 RepID=A0A917JEN1_9ENTE|nr:ABC transporter substrate-binding protein [Enterococcus alcedinis]MBP2101034.1 peptide/nickel transport system substrate-binding protein [Enterococcus alcedinis]GGI64667.1 peptide ABC transporter substrate-binding protein [Enterococcus alcedinis]